MDQSNQRAQLSERALLTVKQSSSDDNAAREKVSPLSTMRKKISGDKSSSMQAGQEKVILNNLHGCLRPGCFSSIMGPSGSGKTTLLNFLSGRLVADNLTITGELLLNSVPCNSIEKYSNQIAYVMQDDILLATFSPREAFTFVANMRCPRLSEHEKRARVEDIIRELGLQKCANTKIGNEFIRGVSGGERKRTSIGVELLTNPAMLFLDEPTTGLDSATARQVIELLQMLSGKGVNVISTIHQPSSEIFNLFDNLLLLVRGNIIYQGQASQAIDYFAQLNFKIPPYSNPADYFMKIMNEEGLMVEKLQQGLPMPNAQTIEQEFQDRLSLFVRSYTESPMSKQQEPRFDLHLQENKTDFNVSLSSQFILLFNRSLKHEIRNPMDFMVKFAQQIFFALATIIVFYNLGPPGIYQPESQKSIQNRVGVLFFLVTMQAFGSIQGSIATFSTERGVFLREKMNNSYSTGVYFWAKSLAEFPFQLLYPLVILSITYFVIKLATGQGEFWWLVLICILTYQAGTSYGILLSVFISKLELAMSLVPVLVIPLMVMGGFFVQAQTIPAWFGWIQYISMFKYGFQAAVWNEFSNEAVWGIDLPKQNLGFTLDMQNSMYALIVLAVAIRIMALIGMYIIANPRRPKILKPSNATHHSVDIKYSE